MPKYHSPKIPLPVKDSGPHINMVLWAPRVHIPYGISVDSATFVDRQTHTKVDHATCARKQWATSFAVQRAAAAAVNGRNKVDTWRKS